MSDSVRPHRWQPTRPLHPWDSPGKNTEVGCHFLLQCMKVKSESEVVQLCPTPSHPMDCSPPGSSIHGIFQARVLECVASAFSEKPSAVWANSLFPAKLPRINSSQQLQWLPNIGWARMYSIRQFISVKVKGWQQVELILCILIAYNQNVSINLWA